MPALNEVDEEVEEVQQRLEVREEQQERGGSSRGGAAVEGEQQ
jgi:hypothetical protein